MSSNTSLIESNLCSGLKLNDGETIDIIVFNPPYVATEKEELDNAQTKKGIEAAWAGGEHGIQVLLEFLP